VTPGGAAMTDLNTSAGDDGFGKSSVSVVVPVYNSEETLCELASRLATVLRQSCDQYELILVNDGSRDGSWDQIQRLAVKHQWIRGINLMRNYGQHNALLCGIRAVRHPITLVMDDDLQHPPEEIPRLLQKLAEGYDVVYAPPQEEQHGFWRNTAARITKLSLQSVLGAETAGKVSPYRAFCTRLRDAFASYQSSFVSIDVLLAWATNRFAAVSVRYDPRRAGKSQYTFRRLVTHALNMMTGFSILPLQLATLVGFFFTIFGVVIFAYVIGRYLIHGVVVRGFTFLASVVTIFAGAQLFALGVFGEYLARIHFRMMERPSYVVRCSTPEPAPALADASRKEAPGTGLDKKEEPSA
jgi:glycosyltransferase involved in cell wall biosynthesis